MEVQAMAKRPSKAKAGVPLSLRLPEELGRKIDEVHARYVEADRELFTRAFIIRLAIEEGLPMVNARIKRDVQNVIRIAEKRLAEVGAEMERRKGGQR